jgi:hypothetical protein
MSQQEVYPLRFSEPAIGFVFLGRNAGQTGKGAMMSDDVCCCQLQMRALGQGCANTFQIRASELQAQLERNHARSAVTAQTNSE